jgi:hypothetical protein
MSVAKPRGETGYSFKTEIKTPPSSTTSETWKKEMNESDVWDRSTTLTNRKYNRTVDHLDQQRQIWANKWISPPSKTQSSGGRGGTGGAGMGADLDSGDY